LTENEGYASGGIFRQTRWRRKMDPNETLNQIFDVVESIKAKGDLATVEELVLVERLSDLDEWLTGGGFFPDKWIGG
jgi:hypothetical protein